MASSAHPLYAFLGNLLHVKATVNTLVGGHARALTTSRLDAGLRPYGSQTKEGLLSRTHSTSQ